MHPHHLPILAAAGLIATGIAGIAFPEPLARNFGAPLQDGAGSEFVRATAVRDIALGAILFSAALNKERSAVRVASLCCIGISLSDFLTTKKPIHLAGAGLFVRVLLGL